MPVKVGQMVRYFTKNPKKQFRDIKEGPYAAIVTALAPDGSAELKVFVPLGGLDYLVDKVYPYNNVPGDDPHQWLEPL